MVYYFLLLESISLDEHGAKNMEANLEQWRAGPASVMSLKPEEENNPRSRWTFESQVDSSGETVDGRHCIGRTKRRTAHENAD